MYVEQLAVEQKSGILALEGRARRSTCLTAVFAVGVC